jgi:hypothetical protein
MANQGAVFNVITEYLKKIGFSDFSAPGYTLPTEIFRDKSEFDILWV